MHEKSVIHSRDMKPSKEQHNNRIQGKIKAQQSYLTDLEVAKEMMIQRGQSTEATDRMIENAKSVISGLKSKLRT